MWIFFAFGSAFFVGITAILAKCGIRKTDSDVATAVRTIVVLIFAWIMVWIAGSAHDITALSAKTWVFLVLSGLATGASWLCYYKALQDGPASAVASIDKLSILVSIAFSFFVFKERLSQLQLAPRADRRRNDDDARLTRITGSCGRRWCLIEQPVVDAGFPGYDHYHEDDEVHECTGVACDDIGNCIDHTALHLTSGESVSREFEYFPYACEGR